jgi:hypothetical protein
MVRPELTGEPFDVIVVGAGINGVGITQDAALRGLRVALLGTGRPVQRRVGLVRPTRARRAALSRAVRLRPGARVAVRARAALPARPAPGETGAADGAHLQAQPAPRVDGRAGHDRL